MTYVWTLAVILFVAAYGNAMLRRVARRQVMIESGKDVPELGKAYKRTGATLFLAGAFAFCVWFTVLTFGNPAALFVG